MGRKNLSGLRLLDILGVGIYCSQPIKHRCKVFLRLGYIRNDAIGLRVLITCW